MLQSSTFNDTVRVHIYGYRPSSLQEGSFHVVKRIKGTSTFEPIGDFIPLGRNETPDTLERKIMNVINILNDEELVAIEELSREKVLYQKTGEQEDSVTEDDNIDETESGETESGALILRSLPGEGVSIPDALLSFSDAKAQTKFFKNLVSYCDVLSTKSSYRNPNLYGGETQRQESDGPAYIKQ